MASRKAHNLEIVGSSPTSATNKMNKIELSYIAGLFDGEGDVGVYSYKATKNGKSYPKLTARIHNTNEKALLWTQKILGFGSVYRDRIGIKKSGHYGTKQGFAFIVTHRQARKFIPLILPYLIIKKDKALEALEIDQKYTNKKKPSRRSSIGRAWDAPPHQK